MNRRESLCTAKGFGKNLVKSEILFHPIGWGATIFIVGWRAGGDHPTKV